MNIANKEQNNTGSVEDALMEAEKKVKEALVLSIKEINHKPVREKEIFDMWSKYANRISDFFFQEVENSGNPETGKNVMKYIMFKKF